MPGLLYDEPRDTVDVLVAPVDVERATLLAPELRTVLLPEVRTVLLPDTGARPTAVADVPRADVVLTALPPFLAKLLVAPPRVLNAPSLWPPRALGQVSHGTCVKWWSRA